MQRPDTARCRGIAYLVGVTLVKTLASSISALMLALALANHAAATEISLFHLRGDAEGYLQTPAGGQPGSTTSERPTLKELGFDSLSIYDVSVSRIFAQGKHKFLGGLQFISADSTTVLNQDLTSQNRNFPAGTTVNADLQTDWLRFNWLYKWRAAKFSDNSFAISPGAGLVLFDFHYQLESNTAKADRAYSKLGYRVGGEIDWRISDKFALKFELFEGLPLPNTPVILSAGLRGKYTLWNKKNTGSVVAGVAYNRIDYEDQQPFPNHIRIESGPLFTIGLEIGI